MSNPHFILSILIVATITDGSMLDSMPPLWGALLSAVVGLLGGIASEIGRASAGEERSKTDITYGCILSMIAGCGAFVFCRGYFGDALKLFFLVLICGLRLIKAVTSVLGNGHKNDD